MNFENFANKVILKPYKSTNTQQSASHKSVCDEVYNER